MKHMQVVTSVTCNTVSGRLHVIVVQLYQHDFQYWMRFEPGFIAYVAAPAIVQFREVGTINALATDE